MSNEKEAENGKNGDEAPVQPIIKPVAQGKWVNNLVEIAREAENGKTPWLEHKGGLDRVSLFPLFPLFPLFLPLSLSLSLSLTCSPSEQLFIPSLHHQLRSSADNPNFSNSIDQ